MRANRNDTAAPAAYLAILLSIAIYSARLIHWNSEPQGLKPPVLLRLRHGCSHALTNIDCAVFCDPQ